MVKRTNTQPLPPAPWSLARRLALSLVLFGSFLSPAGAQTVTGSNLGRVIVDSGSFEHLGGTNWVEKDANGDITFNFDETRRDASSVYLEDPSRGVSIQLDLSRDMVIYSDGTNTFDLYAITDKFAAPAAAPDTAPANALPDSISTEYMSFERLTKFSPSDPVCSIPKTWDGISDDLDGEVGNDILDGIIPDFYYEKFESACRSHDFCYASPWIKAGIDGGRRLCDNQFLEDMHTICNDQHDDGSPNWSGCRITAGIMYEAVDLKGQNAFDKGQENAENNTKLLQTGSTVTKAIVSIVTADETGAGTDANITVTIHGTSGDSSAVVINPYFSGNALESGDTDTTREFPLGSNIGTPTAVTLKTDDAYAGSDWLPLSVTVSMNGRNYVAHNSSRTWLEDEGQTLRLTLQ